MKRTIHLILIPIKWLLFGVGALSLLGYLFNIIKATLKGGWEGFVSIHHHNAYVNGRAPSFFDYVFYPLLIVAIFLIGYILHLLASKLRK